MTDYDQIGIINEQGFVAGDFGFRPITESEKKKIADKEEQDIKAKD